MATLSNTDIDLLVKQFYDLYRSKGGVCRATPAQMNNFLDRLEAYTEEVQDQAENEGLDEDENVAQWGSDMASWQQRMAHYRAEVESVSRSQWKTTKGCEAIYRNVVSPLLEGVWYEVLPGIVFSAEEATRIQAGTGASNRKPPDAHVPFSLGNQVLIYREHQKERAEKFWEDLKASAKGLLKGVKNVGETLLPWVLGASAIAAVWLLAKHQRKKMRY